MGALIARAQDAWATKSFEEREDLSLLFIKYITNVGKNDSMADRGKYSKLKSLARAASNALELEPLEDRLEGLERVKKQLADLPPE